MELSPFARRVDGSDVIVERFEGYIGGTEICNAFSELNDADEDAARFRMQAEGAGNVEAEPGDPDYVEAPRTACLPAAGSFRRPLAMMFPGKDSIRDVVPSRRCANARSNPTGASTLGAWHQSQVSGTIGVRHLLE